MAKLKITETVLQDAQQSLISSHMLLDEMMPILGELDQVGYHSCEVWGGETFDACIRVLDEDPWQRLRSIRERMPNTKLQMFFHGQSILGERQFSDDIVEYFIQRSIASGIDIMRISDALNDIRNLEYSIQVARKEGAHVQPVISYTTSPVHNSMSFIQYAKKLEEVGADSICIQDPAGLMTPYAAYELIAAIKNEVSVPIQLHCNCVSGLAPMAYLKAAEAGVDMLNTAISPLSEGSSLPATESIIAAFEGTPYDAGLDMSKIFKVEKYFYQLRKKFVKDGRLDPVKLSVDSYAIQYRIPSSLITFTHNKLKESGKPEKLEEALMEISRVREDSGFAPLARPVSHIIAEQAAINIIEGKRYNSVTVKFRELVRGAYGLTPAAIDPVFRKEILGDEKPINVRPADLLDSELDKFRTELPEKYNEQQEDLLTLAQFPQTAPKYFQTRSHKLYGIDGRHADELTQVHPI